jgi:hypothetical protein
MSHRLFDELCVLVPALGVTFAGFCIWLAVRIFSRRERWAKRLAVALVVAQLGYLLSFGLIARLEFRGSLPRSLKPAFEAVYFPFGWGVNFGPQWIRSPIIWYLDLWGAK